MEIIKMRARDRKQILADMVADVLGIPEDVKNDLTEMAIIQKEVVDRMDNGQAIPIAGIERYNKLAYLRFPKQQDGGEFTKEEPKPEEVPPTHPVRQKRPGGTPTVCDMKAEDIVNNYIVDHLDKSDPVPNFEVYIVWKCKTLQNWKWLLASTLPDSMYYELTYNGDKGEYYLDAYRKVENKVIRDGALA